MGFWNIGCEINANEKKKKNKETSIVVLKEKSKQDNFQRGNVSDNKIYYMAPMNIKSCYWTAQFLKCVSVCV